MTFARTQRAVRRGAAAPLALVVLLACGAPSATEPRAQAAAERAAPPAAAPLAASRRQVAFEGRSSYNQVRVVDENGIRSLLFVRPDGTEVAESAMSLLRSDQLVLRYMHGLFLTLLVTPEQQRCLIVGLGGGDMVRFLNAHFPELHVDVVEIDPVVVDVARRFFHVESGPRVTVYEQDGYDFLAKPGPAYDAIYLDAFMVPNASTDTQGAPLRMKSEEFLRGVQARLAPGGVLSINLNRTAQTDFDVAAFSRVFPRGSRVDVPGTGNIILLGSEQPFSEEAARPRARELEATGLALTSLLDFVTPISPES